MRVRGFVDRLPSVGGRKVLLNLRMCPEVVAQQVMDRHTEWARVMRAVLIEAAGEVSVQGFDGALDETERTNRRERNGCESPGLNFARISN